MRNGSGTYSLPGGNPVISGTIITSTWANTTMPDIGDELTNSLARDGQSPMNADLPMGGYKVTGMADGVATTDGMTVGQLANTSSPALGDTLVGVKSILTGSVARTQHDKNAESSSVLDFGADSTGVADSAAAFSAAGAAASEIHVPAGIWKLNSTPTASGTVVWVIHRGASFTGAGNLPGNIVSLSSFQPSWLSSAYNTAWAYMSQNAIASYPQPGNLGFQVAGQTLANNGALIGFSSALRNNTGAAFTGSSWCFYGTTVADNGGGGGTTQAMEVDIVAMSTNTGGTYGIAINAGGELADQIAMGYVFKPVVAGLLIAQNNAGAYANCVFSNGIQIAENAIDPATQRAILLGGNSLKIRWQTAAGSDIGYIGSTATTTAQSQSIDMSPFGTVIRNSVGQTVFQINNNNNAATSNYLLLSAFATGSVPQIASAGTDANIDIQIAPKGTGNIWLGPFTAGAVAQTGYMTVKDSAGNVRRLLIG